MRTTTGKRTRRRYLPERALADFGQFLEPVRVAATLEIVLFQVQVFHFVHGARLVKRERRFRRRPRRIVVVGRIHRVYRVARPVHLARVFSRLNAYGRTDGTTNNDDRSERKTVSRRFWTTTTTTTYLTRKNRRQNKIRTGTLSLSCVFVIRRVNDVRVPAVPAAPDRWRRQCVSCAVVTAAATAAAL